MASPIIGVSLAPGEQAVVAVGKIIEKIIDFNLQLYQNASPEKRVAIADAILSQNLRGMMIWERLLDFFHVPKITP